MQNLRTVIRFMAAIACGSLILAPTHVRSGDRPINQPIELRVLQTVSDGVTGILYRIEPSGAFVVKTLINDVEGELVISGELDLSAVMEISQKLYAAQLEDQPQRSEMFTGKNPVLIDLRYGKLARVISLPPGQAKASTCEISGGGKLCRILKLYDAITKSAR